jgi:hypothetical protein
MWTSAAEKIIKKIFEAIISPKWLAAKMVKFRTAGFNGFLHTDVHYCRAYIFGKHTEIFRYHSHRSVLGSGCNLQTGPPYEKGGYRNSKRLVNCFFELHDVYLLFDLNE